MPQKLKASLPPDYDFPASWVVQLTAVDPSTGNLVSGVNVSKVAIVAEPVTPETTDTPPTLVPVPPVWLPEELPASSGGGT
jgi:hypothetical protein